MTKKYAFTIDQADAGRRLDQFLASRLSGESSRTGLQKMIKTRGVRLNGKAFSKANHVLKEGDRIEFALPERASKKLIGEAIPVDVIYEDEDLLALNKPTGMVVHPGAGNLSGTLVHALVGAGKALFVAASAGGRRADCDDPTGHCRDRRTQGTRNVPESLYSHLGRY